MAELTNLMEPEAPILSMEITVMIAVRIVDIAIDAIKDGCFSSLTRNATISPTTIAMPMEIAIVQAQWMPHLDTPSAMIMPLSDPTLAPEKSNLPATKRQLTLQINNKLVSKMAEHGASAMHNKYDS